MRFGEDEGHELRMMVEVIVSFGNPKRWDQPPPRTQHRLNVLRERVIRERVLVMRTAHETSTTWLDYFESGTRVISLRHGSPRSANYASSSEIQIAFGHSTRPKANQANAVLIEARFTPIIRLEGTVLPCSHADIATPVTNDSHRQKPQGARCKVVPRHGISRKISSFAKSRIQTPTDVAGRLD